MFTREYPDWLLYFRQKALNVFSNYSIPRWLVFIFDNLSVFALLLFAYILRFNFDIAEIKVDLAVSHAIIVAVVYAIFSLTFKSYAGLIRHTTLTDIFLVFVVSTLSSTVLLVLSFISRLMNSTEVLTIPISIILIHFGMVTVFFFFVRVFIKIVFRFATKSNKTRKKVLICGAGELGFVVKRVILSDPEYGFDVAGFIDDDKNLQGKKINGIPVLGTDKLETNYLKKNRIETLILAVKGITIDEKSNIIRNAISLGLEVLETPEVDKWAQGQLKVTQFQRVRLEDLLGRDPIKLNMSLLKEGLNQKTILITGAAGSIGSEIVRQLARFNAKSVILVDQAETPIFYLANELKEKYVDLRFKLLIADVTNAEKMDIIFNEFRPEIVFHAAAYKHVPLMEDNPHEAVRVNIGGAVIVTDLAVKYNVEKLVMISTDKSVNPTSIMGASKRICEQIVQARAQAGGHSTQFIITRFGNVLGSNGSVIPLFSKQIQNGGPVTVTHPEVFRYFMTIPEACQLVLEAGFMGNGGEIFVFDMGEPVKIADLATHMIKLSGLIPGKDIQIVYTGLRPGEKLFEELLTDKEATLPTHHPKIMKARVEIINGDVVLNKVIDVLGNLYELSKSDIVKIIKELVPEYNNSNDKMLQPDHKE